jgi:glutamyl-tRNA reductase
MSTARRLTPDEKATTSDSENLPRRSTELERAEPTVTEEVNHVTPWVESREIIPTVVALRQRFDDIRRAELTRLEPKLSALSPEGRTRLDEISLLVVEKLLLTPTEQLKLLGDGTSRVQYVDALNRLFRLGVDDQIEALSEGSEAAVSTGGL